MPVAIQHPRPWIQVAAVSQSQTANTTMLFSGMITAQLSDDYHLDVGKTVIYAPGRGKIEAITSNPRSIEGGRPSLAIAAETQNWLASNDGHEMAAAIRRNLAKSNDGSARVLEINNAHLVGEDSVAERTYEAYRKSDGSLPGLYYDSVEAPETDLTDTAALTEAIDAARGDASWLDVERLVEEIEDPTTSDSDAKRFYLNQPASLAGERWMDSERWDTATEPFEPIADFTEVVLAFDGSHSGDSTALVVATLEDSPRLDVVDCWELPADDVDPEWQVPVEDVEDAIRAACKRWKVREIACDTHGWLRSFQILEKERLPVVDFPQTPSRMIPATKMFMESVVNGRFRPSPDVRLRRHIMNAVLKTSSRGGQIFKDSKTSPRKIDLAVASVMALERAVFYRKRTSEVVSPWDLLSGEDGDSPEDVIQSMRDDYQKLLDEAAEERKDLNEFLHPDPGTEDQGSSGERYPVR
jgi:hypothetical protein